MSRAAAVVCVLELLGCSDRTWIIGRDTDAGQVAVDAGNSECEGPRAGALLCADFEAGDLETEWDDVATENAGEIERSTVRAHGGAASLHAVSRAAMSAAVIVRDFPAVSSGTLYLRAHLYVPADLPTEIINLFYVGAQPGPDPFIGIDFNVQDGAVEVFSPQGEPSRQVGDPTIPRERWFCFRAEIAISDADGTVDVSVDDALALHATGIDTLPPGGLTQLRAGIDWSSNQSELFEVYLDDLVLDTAPIACLAP